MELIIRYRSFLKSANKKKMRVLLFIYVTLKLGFIHHPLSYHCEHRMEHSILDICIIAYGNLRQLYLIYISLS